MNKGDQGKWQEVRGAGSARQGFSPTKKLKATKSVRELARTIGLQQAPAREGKPDVAGRQ